MPFTPLLGTPFAEVPGRSGQAKITFPGTFSAENLSIVLGRYWRKDQPVVPVIAATPEQRAVVLPPSVAVQPPLPARSVAIPQTQTATAPVIPHDLDSEKETMAIDWGSVLTGAIGGAFGLETPGFQPAMGFLDTTTTTTQAPVARAPVAASPVMTAGSCDGMAWTGGVPPKGYKVVNYCGQGVLRKVRRRRRRRLLTCSDKADIAAVVGMVGKGQLASSIISRIGCP